MEITTLDIKKYILMSLDTSLVEISAVMGSIVGIGEFKNFKNLPMGITDTNSLLHWFTTRRIPSSRKHLDELETKTGMHTHELIAKSFALSLSDSFWIKPKDSNLKWSDVNFFTNGFTDDIGSFLINGDGELGSLISPSNTTDGVFPKKWIILNNIRSLAKQGDIYNSKFDHLNEVFAYRVGKILSRKNKTRITPYLELGNDSCVCPNFILEGQNLVSAYSYLQHKNLRPPDGKPQPSLYAPLCEPFGSIWLETMLLIDYTVFNKDRHMKNFGFVQNAITGELLFPAPVYDCGSSMFYCISFGKERPLDNMTFHSRPFYKKHDEQIQLVDLGSFKDELHDLRSVCYDIYMDTYEKCGLTEEILDGVGNLVVNRVNNLLILASKTNKITSLKFN